MRLWGHREKFEPGDHWYEYLIGATHEDADVRGIYLPKLDSFAGFIEVFCWEGGLAIESLYILPAFRRRGIGSQLIKDIESGTEGVVTIWASRATHDFYARLGYHLDKSQGGFIMVKGDRRPGTKTYSQAAAIHEK